MTENSNDTASKPKIKPIETEYKGYRFRSRLEARWAVYFDNTVLEESFSKAYGIPKNKPYITWEYEKEGFELSEGDRYLPDFYLRPYNCYAEVKPEPLNQKTANILFKFVKETQYRLLLLIGTPDIIPHRLLDIYRPPLFLINGQPEENLPRKDYLSGENIGHCYTSCGIKDFEPNVKIPGEIETLCVCMFDYAGIKERRFYVMPCGDEFKHFDHLIFNPVKASRMARFEFGESP